MESYIVSPKTGKDIIVGGPTYQKLLKSNYAPAIKKAKMFEKNRSHQRQRGKTTKSSEVKLSKSNVVRHKGSGSATKGWKDDAPKRGVERSALKTKCGDTCFLKPETNGFPICAALRTGKGCKVDCRAVISAQVRAGIWDYKDVHKVAMELNKKYGCK
jgi:hypothetical protein